MKARAHDRQLAELAANVVGIDPHKHTLSATIVDARGGVVSRAHFNVSESGPPEPRAVGAQLGGVSRWGIENASGVGRPTAMFLCERGHDVRDVCAQRTHERSRRRRQGKSDALDSERIARETSSDPCLPLAFKRAGDDSGPDETRERFRCGTTKGARSSSSVSSCSTRRRRF